jgi:hypothetical protein
VVGSACGVKKFDRGRDLERVARIHNSEAVDGHIRDEETWWALDGSGEVRNRSTRQDKYPGLPTGVYDAGEFPAELFAGKDVSELSTDPAGRSATALS